MPIKLFKFAGILVQTLDEEKYVRWTLWTIASPFILFIILCILIYLPPIQNFLVDKAAVYASEATGMNISVGRISLSFPLNLVVTNVDAASLHNDTLLSVRRLQVNVQLLPLLKSRWKWMAYPCKEPQ